MTDPDFLQGVEAVRHFTRFYTRRIGVLHEGLLGSPFSLTEARILYEIAHHEETTATELGRELELDAGYLSRTLKGIENRGLIRRTPSKRDGRRSIVSLTDAGQEAFATMNARSRAEVSRMLERLSPAEQRRLTDAMTLIESYLGDGEPQRAPYILRPHQPGDMGWVIQRHGELYSEEYGWDDTFEALVAEIASRFIRELDPGNERCWIAEKDGQNVGCVFLVKQSPDIAKLRLLLVEPAARGLGIGRRLVEECIRFARQRGYRHMDLWTNDVLSAARHIYEKAGFRLLEEEAHHSFGHDLVGQNWRLDL